MSDVHSDVRTTTSVRADIGHRLAEERVGKRLSQDDLARAVGRTRRAVAGWEAGDATPDAEVLCLADQAGIDVLYVVTGRRGGALTAQESMLVSYVKDAPPPVVNAALQTVQAMATLARADFTLRDKPGMTLTIFETKNPAPDTAGAHMVFNDQVHQAIGRDLHTQGTVFHAPENPAASKPRRPRK